MSDFTSDPSVPDFTGQAQPNVFLSADAMQSQLKKVTDQSAVTAEWLKQQMGPLEELQHQADGLNTSFKATMSSLMDKQSNLDEQLVKSLVVPEKIGKIFSLFGDQRFNREYQKAQVDANAQRMTNEQFKYKTALDAVRQKTDDIKTQMGIREHVDDVMAKNFELMINGYNATREAAKQQRDQSTYDLMNTYSAQELAALDKKTAPGGVLTLKGKTFQKADIGAALAGKQKLDLEHQKLVDEVMASRFKNEKDSTEYIQAQTDKITEALAWPQVENILKAGKGYAFTTPGGQSMKIDPAGFAQSVFRTFTKGKDTREYLNTLNQGIGTSVGELQTLANKGTMLVNASNFDPVQRPELLANLNEVNDTLNTLKQTQSRLDASRSSETSMLMPQDMGILSGNMGEYIANLKKKVGGTFDKMSTDYAKSLPKWAQQAWVEMQSNGGRIVTNETAVNTLGNAIANPTGFGFTGSRAMLNDSMFGALGKAYGGMGNVLDKDGKLKSDINISMLLQNTQSLAQDPNFKFLQASNQFSQYGGFKGAVRAIDISDIFRQGAVQFAKQFNQPDFENGLVQPNGEWTPNIAPLVNKMGPIAALNGYIGSLDAQNIAKGVYTANDAILPKFYTFVLSQMQKGNITSLAGGDQTNAATDYFVYGNQKIPTLMQMVDVASKSAPSAIQNEITELVRNPGAAGVNDARSMAANQGFGSGADPTPVALQTQVGPPKHNTNPFLKRYWGF